MAAPPILQGQDVVLAAETGSGKTYAYLVPLISRLVKRKALALQATDPLRVGPSGYPAQHEAALVLCPNSALCDQVTALIPTRNCLTLQRCWYLSASVLRL